jgi:(p)ppGpp synthase/HD superfamily hydrolase
MMKNHETYTREELDRFTNFVSIVKKARAFATHAHKGIFRKGKDHKGERLEYITHPIAVARILHTYKSSHKIALLVSACMLHDTVEDVEWVTIEVIREHFGDLVASLVEELTSDPKGVEMYGKTTYLTIKMTTMSTWGLGIKLADRLHNLSDVQSKIDGGKPSDIKWVVKYCTSTFDIIRGVEEGRTLTNTHKRLIEAIKKAIEPGLNIEGYDYSVYNM